MKRVLLSIACLSLPASLNAAEAPRFDVAIAADQKQITTESLESEAQMFKALGEWQTANEMLANARNEVEHNRKELDRAVPLAKQGQISLEKLALAKYKHRKAVNDLAHLEQEKAAALASANVYKNKMLADGNPEQDHRLDLVKARIEEARARLACAQASIDTIGFERALVHERMVRGQSLLKNASLAEADVDDRVEANVSAEARLQSAQRQAELTRAQLGALEASRRRLESGKD